MNASPGDISREEKMGPKWLSHLACVKQMVRAHWGGSPHLPSLSAQRQWSRHTLAILPAPGWLDLPGMLQGPLLQSRRARLQTNRILSWARAAPRTGNRAAFQTPCCLADVIPPSPQVWPGPGAGAGKRRGLGGASWGESAGHSESSGLLSPFHR